MSSGTWQPTLFKNSYIYSSLNYKNIPVIGYTGYYGIEPAANTFLMCNSNNDWVTIDQNTYVSSEKLTDTLANYTTTENLTQTLQSYPTKSELGTIIESDFVTSSYFTTYSNNINLELSEINNNINAVNILASSNYESINTINGNLGNYALKVDLSNYAEVTEFNNLINSVNGLQEGLTDVVTNINSSLADYITIEDAGDYVVTNTAFTLYKNDMNTQIETINNNITDLQEDVNTQSEEISTLQTTVGTQGNSISTLETTVSGHTTQISALEASLSSALSDIEYNSQDINSVNILATSNFESIQLLTTSTTGLLASAESMIEITDTINNRLFINSFETFSNLDTIANNYTLTLSQTLTTGTYLITGNVTLYVSDITKMVPEDDLITDVNWIASLPILNISVNNNNIIGMQQKIETNRPLETIPINNAVEITNDTNELIFTINIPNTNNISITVNDIYMYSINLYFVQLH